MTTQSTDTITIVVNAQQKTVPNQPLSFEEAILLAFPQPPSGPYIVFTVAYRMPVAQEPQGLLTAGGPPVQPKNRMIFDVSYTDKS